MRRSSFINLLPFLSGGFGLLITVLILLVINVKAVEDRKVLPDSTWGLALVAGGAIGSGVGLFCKLFIRASSGQSDLYEATVTVIKNQILEDAAQGSFYDVEATREKMRLPPVDWDQRVSELPPHLSEMLDRLLPEAEVTHETDYEHEPELLPSHPRVDPRSTIRESVQPERSSDRDSAIPVSRVIPAKSYSNSETGLLPNVVAQTEEDSQANQSDNVPNDYWFNNGSGSSQ